MNKQTMKTLNKLSFGISIFTLAAALTCGVLRRTGLAEFPVFVTGWIMPVLTAAAVGYLTNWLAIQLLFRPYAPVKWLGGLQGMIPGNQDKLADTLAEQIPANLMPTDKFIFQVRRTIRESMKKPELPDRLHAMVSDYIKDEHRKTALARQIAAILGTAGATGIEAGLTPSNVRSFYHTHGAGFVKEKVIRNKALRTRILDELKEQVPGLVGEVRTGIANKLREYLPDYPLLRDIPDRLAGENFLWRKLEQSIRSKLSGPDADETIEQKLAEFGSRMESYIDSPELEADIAALKRDGEIGCALTSMSDDLAEKLLEFLEDELVWRFIREKAIPNVRVFLQIQITRNKDAIIAGLDLPGHIRKSIEGLKPERVHRLVDEISGNELGMIQLLGFVLGGLAGFVLAFAQ